MGVHHPWVTDRINAFGGNAESYILDSDYGHLAGILRTDTLC